jgi:hypothetical protein
VAWHVSGEWRGGMLLARFSATKHVLSSEPQITRISLISLIILSESQISADYADGTDFQSVS